MREIERAHIKKRRLADEYFKGVNKKKWGRISKTKIKIFSQIMKDMECGSFRKIREMG